MFFAVVFALCFAGIASVDSAPPSAAKHTFGEGNWTASQNGSAIPTNAFVGGFAKGRPLYVVKTTLNDGTVLPGMYDSNTKQVSVIIDKKEFYLPKYSVLVGNNYRWESELSSEENFLWPNNAVVGGHTFDYKDNLYICRVKVEGTKDQVIGRVDLRTKECSYPVGGVEITSKSFDLLLKW